MELFKFDILNTQVFDDPIRDSMYFGYALLSAKKTGSSYVESPHLLMALAGLPGGVTQEILVRAGFSPDWWIVKVAGRVRESDSSSQIEAEESFGNMSLARRSLGWSAEQALLAAAAVAEHLGDATIDELTLFCAARTYSPSEVRALCEDLEWGLNEETQERMGVLTRYLEKKKRRRQTLSAIKACALGLFAIASLILAVGGDLQTAGLGTWAAWLTAGVAALAFVIAVASSPGDDRYGCLDVETISTLTLIVVGLLGVLWLLGQYLWGRL